MNRHGVIDIGTNSVKLLVAGAEGGSPRILRERVAITRLGEGLEERGRFAPGAMDRTLRTVSALAAEARRLGVPRPVAIGTSAFRSSANRVEMVRRLRREARIDVEVLTGRREADLSFAAATSDQHGDGRVAVVDVGGGSTEIAWDDGVRRRRISLPLGAVRLTERHLPTDPIRSEDFQRLIARIRASLSSAVRG